MAGGFRGPNRLCWPRWTRSWRGRRRLRERLRGHVPPSAKGHSVPVNVCHDGEGDIRADIFPYYGPYFKGDIMSKTELFDRLTAISARDMNDHTISPGEAAYLVKVLTEKTEKFDLNYDQIVQLHAQQIIDR